MKHLIHSLWLLSILALVSCEGETVERNYHFSLAEYFENEAAELAQQEVTVQKTLVVAGSAEVDSFKYTTVEDWQKEFAPFIQADFKKADWTAGIDADFDLIVSLQAVHELRRIAQHDLGQVDRLHGDREALVAGQLHQVVMTIPGGSQAFQETPRSHAPAIILAIVPHIAHWASGQIKSALEIRGTARFHSEELHLHRRCWCIGGLEEIGPCGRVP